MTAWTMEKCILGSILAMLAGNMSCTPSYSPASAEQATAIRLEYEHGKSSIASVLNETESLLKAVSKHPIAQQYKAVFDLSTDVKYPIDAITVEGSINLLTGGKYLELTPGNYNLVESNSSGEWIFENLDGYILTISIGGIIPARIDPTNPQYINTNRVTSFYMRVSANNNPSLSIVSISAEMVMNTKDYHVADRYVGASVGSTIQGLPNIAEPYVLVYKQGEIPVDCALNPSFKDICREKQTLNDIITGRTIKLTPDNDTIGGTWLDDELTLYSPTNDPSKWIAIAYQERFSIPNFANPNLYPGRFEYAANVTYGHESLDRVVYYPSGKMINGNGLLQSTVNAITVEGAAYTCDFNNPAAITGNGSSMFVVWNDGTKEALFPKPGLDCSQFILMN